MSVCLASFVISHDLTFKKLRLYLFTVYVVCVFGDGVPEYAHLLLL